jgi:predicted aminopeptidase
LVWARWFILALLGISLPLLSGCQISYLVKSAYFQASLLSKRVPIEEALKDPKLTDEQKHKLKLAEEAHDFAESDLGLAHTKSYTTFVQLNRPYVTYVLSAAPKNELQAYKWWYPVVGSLPYRGFFDPESAKDEAEKMKAKGFDVYVRGVSAYSTLGWFSDPVLSSMLGYRDYDLVDTVIHETVHATIYIKSEADFNERLAVFFGNKGTQEFYKKREGPESKTLKDIASDHADEKLFADFIFKEIKKLSSASSRSPSQKD